MHTAAGCSDGLSKMATSLETGKRAMLKARQDTPLGALTLVGMIVIP